jgi:hypothetical protein
MDQDTDDQDLVPLPLESIRIGFTQLGDQVNAALCTQIGDRFRLQEQHGGVLRLQEAIQQANVLYFALCPSISCSPQHAALIPPGEHQIMEDSIGHMLEALSTATVQSRDIPPTAHVTVSAIVHTGRRGRPRIEIDEEFLAHGLQLRGPTSIALVIGHSAQTVRRRALDYRLVEPVLPVYTHNADPAAGQPTRTYNAAPPVPNTLLMDEELDSLMHHVLEIFPAFGCRMIIVHLRQMGHQVPASHVCESYNRVHRPPVSYSNTATGRHPYRVVGPNSLSCLIMTASTVGQQWSRCLSLLTFFPGLRRWHIVIHALIDSFSRFVTRIRANNNNRADTALNLFLTQVVAGHRVPRRVCGDHGTENLCLAQWMEEFYGIEHGAYI